MKRVKSYELRVKSYTLTANYSLLLFCLLLSVFCFLPSALNAQPNNTDYNPYEYAKEELFLTSMGVREVYESEDCATANMFMNTLL